MMISHHTKHAQVTEELMISSKYHFRCSRQAKLSRPEEKHVVWGHNHQSPPVVWSNPVWSNPVWSTPVWWNPIWWNWVWWTQVWYDWNWRTEIEVRCYFEWIHCTTSFIELSSGGWWWYEKYESCWGGETMEACLLLLFLFCAVSQTEGGILQRWVLIDPQYSSWFCKFDHMCAASNQNCSGRATREKPRLKVGILSWTFWTCQTCCQANLLKKCWNCTNLLQIGDSLF